MIANKVFSRQSVVCNLKNRTSFSNDNIQARYDAFDAFKSTNLLWWFVFLQRVTHDIKQLYSSFRHAGDNNWSVATAVTEIISAILQCYRIKLMRFSSLENMSKWWVLPFPWPITCNFETICHFLVINFPIYCRCNTRQNCNY